MGAPFRSLGERAAISLGVAAGTQGRAVEQIMARHGLTSTQYNVLRILRGAPDGCSRNELLSRLMFPTADLTRLVDRLVDRGLVRRTESTHDRRVRIHAITNTGLDLIDGIQPDLDEFHARLEAGLEPEALRQLARLCEAVTEAFGAWDRDRDRSS